MSFSLSLYFSCLVVVLCVYEKGGQVWLTSEGALAAVGVEDLGTPAGLSAVVRVLSDLEPVAGAIGSGGVVDLGHVDHDRAEVVATDGLVVAAAVVGLLVHLNRQGTAGCGLRFR